MMAVNIMDLNLMEKSTAMVFIIFQMAATTTVNGMKIKCMAMENYTSETINWPIKVFLNLT